MNKELIDLLDSYSVPAPAIELLKKARVVFVVGISGAGKNTIIKELLKTDKYKLVISHTTRQPRKNHGVLERDGKDYHFIDEGTAESMLANDEFIEAKQYSGNIYGTSLKEVEDAYNEGKIAISDIEVQGVAEYMNASPNVIPIFILPPDFETWQERLRLRYGGKEPDQADMQKRMETAKKELQEALSKDYFEFVINDDLSRAVSAVDEVAHGSLSTEKNKQARQLAQDLLSRLNA
jgi:guanylate kinase